MTIANTMTIEFVRSRLDYEPENGALIWKNGARAGKTAGRVNKQRGYSYIELIGRNWSAHRVAWFWVHGEWPPNDLDHINGERSDNRLCNLRPATRSQNILNSRRHKDSSSGYKGVSVDKRDGIWSAEIYVRGKKMYLGRYKTAQEAHSAYLAAAKVHAGEFANTGASGV